MTDSSAAQVRTPNAKKHRAPSAQHLKSASARTVAPANNGTQSDSALAYSGAASPRPARRQKQKTADVKGGASPSHKQATPGGAHSKTRPPASNGAVTVPMGAKEDLRYAGATFSASPAAASLPVPRFATRSASNVTGSPNFAREKMREPQSEVFDSSPEVVPASPAIPPSSPLDLLFKADRAEKAKSINANVGGQRGALPNGKSIFLDETANGNAGRQNTPGTHSSPRPGMSDRSLSSPGAWTPPANDDEGRQAASKSLKALLFGQPLSPTASPPPPFVMDDPRTSRTPDATPQSYHNRTPSAPFTPPSEQRNQNAYHYGNRNLSPLFKAARGDTPARPSNLNHVMGNYHERGPGNPAHSSNQFSGSSINHFPYGQGGHPNQQQGMPRQAGMNQPFMNNNFAGNHTPNGYTDWAASASPEHPRTTGGRDTSAMENDLRRILKLS